MLAPPPRVPIGAKRNGSGNQTIQRVRRGRTSTRRDLPVAARIPALAQVLRHGLRDMEAEIDLCKDVISINPGTGATRNDDFRCAPTFLIHPAPEDETKLYFTSGGAQSWRYSWDEAEGCFKAKDGHDLLGMVSRELLWFTTGLPKF